MNKTLLTLTILSLGILTSKVNAAVKWHPPCQQGFLQDSVGRGIEGGFTGNNLLPNPGDQGCYDAGVDEGKSLGVDDQICQQKFSEGRSQGLVEGGSSDLSRCFSYGYTAGLALLRVDARAGIVGDSPRGQECLNYYQKGWADSAAHAQKNSNSNDTLRSDCYLTGFYDQQQLN